ncbi:Proteinase inhibitor I2, Kunitz metazoa domain and Cysteine-rich repeat and Lustrin, cysteine-rich repeated domain-containing protein [Strongyloides ratti]|uniref:Proteinase inhibitor I2, Kunitz metazoa domain and Cysteine-rich repeat and Lustrin, cysteine-rich repeated domain-containing protein n=1 Tax=Strongyloides ratti TaxID=34506 RepID=A0A090LEA1_STRRB|nr:Proteinase inhibitor I2, Kunitz metazoa domain and Cysteine-rich repeat and Lustrin, cysteine-rich repeated domain-containing protein [Strongyloides ratti]CEF66473.1 Proteinase inhibitor I2, Kunitz metazoa domain and Cysteine-rich repeat and Lustrin, cysteine-rich repeated domain-containing protein [Strongyloides ratti]
MYCIILFSSFLIVSKSVELGGVLCSQPKNYGYECGKFKPHIAYYFDINILKCVKFQFKGCGGNQNRFGTYNECNNGCGSLSTCRKGLPYMDFGGNIKHCNNGKIKCPYGYECVGIGSQSVCCKEKETICAMNVEPGKGCNILPETRYFFDSSANVCRSFIYLGCGGNDNNFHSKGDCMKYCQKEISCLKGEPYPDRFSPSRSLHCKTNKDCPTNYECYGKNNENKACCRTLESVCTTKYISDVACVAKHDIKKIWTFDYKMGYCIEKNEISCLDQINSFANLEQCTDYCIGTCPNGMQIHINWITNQPQLCNYEKQLGCPIGYECIKTSNITAICCKTPPTCMLEGSLSYSLPTTNEPIRCNPKSQQSCPFNYQCQEAKNKEYICCTPKIECPYGMEILKYSKNEIKICTPDIPGTCPNNDNYLCIKGQNTNVNVCCKVKKTCISPYVNIQTKKPKKCFPGESICPEGTHCLQNKDLSLIESNKNNTINISSKIFHCCYDMNIYSCPNNDEPILNTTTGLPYECNPSIGKSCPYQYECKELLDSSYACCPLPKNELCKEAVLNPSTGNPVSCKGPDDKLSCLMTSSTCKLTSNNGYYCCKK